MKVVAPLFLLTACTGEIAAQDSAGTSRELPQHPVGEEYVPCEGCPVFVRVPDAPNDLRPIQYVAKYELTWNNFWRSVDDGACEFSSERFNYFAKKPEPVVLQELDLERFRIDWPVTILSRDELRCYTDWINRKSGLEIGLPNADEWRWFAAGGATTDYPWGDEPDPQRAAVRDNPNLHLYPSQHGVQGLQEIVDYVSLCGPVGQFPANGFGLHDVIGLYPELGLEVWDFLEVLKSMPGVRLDRMANRERYEGRKMRRAYGASCLHSIQDAKLHNSQSIHERGEFFSRPYAIRFVIIN